MPTTNKGKPNDFPLFVSEKTKTYEKEPITDRTDSFLDVLQRTKP